MEKKINNPEDFSLSAGGPFHNILVKMGLHNEQGKLAIVCVCFTWLPLLIITTIEGTLFSGTQLPFISDVAMHARVLVALSMLIMIKVVIDTNVNAVTKYISDALITGAVGQIVLIRTLRRAKKLTNSVITEIILILIVIITTISMVKGGAYSSLGEGTTSWMTTSVQQGDTGLSVAGYWAVFISIPTFQFFLFRWLWRYFVWILLLFRLSRTTIDLLPTHADGAGGLGIVMLAQRSFNLIFVAGSVVISGQFIAEIIDQPDTFNVIRNKVIGYIIICIVFIFIPLLFFTGKLFTTKYKGLTRLSILGATLSRKFEGEWVNDLPIEKRIEESKVDPSMLYDYFGLYEALQKLRTVPITLLDILGMAIVLFIPFIPILFIHFSVAELLQKIAGLLA